MRALKAKKSPKKAVSQFVIWYRSPESNVPSNRIGWRSLNLGTTGPYKTQLGAERALARYLQIFPDDDGVYSIREKALRGREK